MKNHLSTTKSQNLEKKVYKCDKCQDTGVIMIDFDTAMPCECKRIEAKKKRMAKLLQFADIPPIYQNIKIKDFDTNRYQNKETAENIKDLAFRYVKHYLSNDLGDGLYLYSRTKGSGKTRMAISIANEVAELFEKQIKYMTVHQLTSSIQSTFKNKEVTSEEVENSVINVDLLILDDLAVENITTWSEAILYNIVDRRNELHKPTIFTANIPVRELPYSDNRIQSRINENTMKIAFPEESVRDQIAQERDNAFLQKLYGGE